MMDLDRVRPKDMPKVRRALFSELSGLGDWMRRLHSEASDPTYLTKRYPWEAEEFGRPLDSYGEDQSWWISADMARVALEASLDIAIDEAATACPSNVGFMFVPTPFYYYSYTYRPAFENGGYSFPEEHEVMDWGVNIIAWRRRLNGTISIAAYDCSVHSDRAYIQHISNFDLSTGGQRPLPSQHEWELVNRGYPYGGQVDFSIARFVAAAWTLAQTPTVATTTTKQVAGPKIKGQRRRQPPSDVKVVELRQMKHQNVTHSSSGRRYTHRWVVRGHWRDQACGPGLKERRKVWVPAYTKGPADAPLIEKETVFAWRR